MKKGRENKREGKKGGERKVRKASRDGTGGRHHGKERKRRTKKGKGPESEKGENELGGVEVQ
jgi:hypothetical protein